jgi:endonuclease-8
MPEGHTVHRLARRLGADGAGSPVRASSPQGRFADGAATIDGLVLLETEALGKHLFLRFEEGRDLHVHLGLFGRFRRRRKPAPEPRGAVRLRLETRRAPWDLSGPTACRIVDPGEWDELRRRVGPDPLRPGDDPEPALARIGASRRPIGALLLDQAVISGVGNVYRAEILHALSIDPMRPGNETSIGERQAIWETSAEMLADGERTGRITTIKDRPGRRLAVYKSADCATCGGEIERTALANRTIYWCPRCQPASG